MGFDAKENFTENETALLCYNSVKEKKATDVRLIDLRSLSGFTDYFLICSASSDRQARAIMDSVESGLREKGLKSYHVEGYETARWILIDCGDVVVHIFRERERGYYDLDSLWADAPVVNIDSNEKELAENGRDKLREVPGTSPETP